MNNNNVVPFPSPPPGAAATSLPTTCPNNVKTLSDLIATCTQETLDKLKQNGQISTLSLRQIKQIVYHAVAVDLAAVNSASDRSAQIRIPKDLAPNQMAMIAMAKYEIRNISCAGLAMDTKYDLLAIYQTDGPNEGIYDVSDMGFRYIARALKVDYSEREYKEFLQTLRDVCERVTPYSGGRFLAVNNGIIDYEDQCRPKRLLPFTPDLVFLNKTRVNYNPAAKLTNIHNDVDGTDWNVEEFLSCLVDDPEVKELLWKILGAIIRPGGNKGSGAWGGFTKCVLLISSIGNNGKGTYCQLARNLCGPGTSMSIPLDKIGSNFLLEPLVGKTAIITDESNVGGYLDEASTLKSLVTHDPIQINRKGLTPIEYRFLGLTMFCLNDLPKVKDKSSSFLRRLLCIEFPHSFEGRERKYIKDDYINRPEVLEYVLRRVVNMPNYYTLPEPQACKAMLEEFAFMNDPMRQFLEEMLPRCVWDLLPFTFLYDLYISYLKRVNPSGSPLGKQAFISNLMDILPNYPDWECPDSPPKNGQPGKPGKKVQRATGVRMNRPEPLIIEYTLANWYNPGYRGTDPDIVARPCIRSSYRGIQRRVPTAKP